MIKKINKFLITNVSIILLIVITIIISFKLVMNSNSLYNSLLAVNYSIKAEETIHTKMSNYIDSSVYAKVVNQNQINSEIKSSLNNFFEGKKTDKTIILNNMNQLFTSKITEYLKNKNLAVNDSSVSILSNNLSNIYVSNFFIIDELNMLVSPYHKINNTLTIVLIISIIIFTFSLYKKYGDTKIIFSSSSIILMSTIFIVKSNTNIYYLNDYISLLINSILNKFILIMFIFSIVYIFTYLLFKIRRTNKRVK